MILSRSSVFLLLILIVVAGCTREIKSGDYGPLTIGQSKLEALAALKTYGLFNKYGLRSVSPVVYNEQYLQNPSRHDLAELFSEEAGIVVWIGGHPFPLRIEFVDNLVSRKWPETRIAPTAPERTKIKKRELARLDQRILLGMSREEVFGAIGEFKSEFSVGVGNFVVGEQRFRRMRQIEFNANEPEYRALILASDGWQFNGLKKEVWYAPIESPFHSKVTIYFRDDRIERIEHWHYPFELL